MSIVSTIAKLTGGDPEYLEQVLESRDAERDKNPAYIQVLTAIGAWVAASFLLGAIGGIAALSIGYSVSGFLVLALGLFIRRGDLSPFIRQMCAGLIISGQLSFSFGIGQHFSDAGVGTFAIFSAAVAVITVYIERRGLVGPMTVAIALAMLAYFLIQSTSVWAFRDILFAIVCVGMALGALLLSHRGMRTEYIAFWSLIALIFFAKFSSFDLFSGQFRLAGPGSPEQSVVQIWGGRFVVWAAAMALLYWSRDHFSKYESIGAGLLMTLCAGGLSFMLSSSAFLLLVGLVMGWRLAALSGVVAIIWSMSRYYYDLSYTLLEKSILLMVVGVALLLGAYLLSKTAKLEEQS